MDDANNHTATFTAADIEKYHRGMLSPKEMHDLEKAALDDPFLADALEGYSVPGVNVAVDIADLKKQLAKRTEGEPAKVIPMGGSTRSFPWLRAAVLVVGIVGAALLTYQLAFNNNKQEHNIAQNRDKETIDGNAKQQNEQVIPADSTVDKIANGTVEFKKSDSMISNSPANISKSIIQSPLNYSIGETPPAAIVRNDDYKLKSADSSVSYYYDSKGDVTTTASAPAKRERDSKPVGDSVMHGYNRNANPIAGADKLNVDGEKKMLPTAEDLAKQKVAQNKKKASEVMADRSVMYNSSTRPGAGNIDTRNGNNFGLTTQQNKDNNYYKLNSFRGQVLDNHNNPLPFANVTNIQDGIGTYADSKGFFNLTSTADSQLNVNVRVLGYNNLNYQLKSFTGYLNKVQMQEDRSLSAQVVEKNKKANEARKSRNTMKLAGEPEPEDGWDNYYSYLDNNTNAPEEALRAKENTSGVTVDISFEVNKYGEPVDIKIERSLCTQCNDEAIRLIKQGPKWKRKAKKGRTTVTISF